MITFVAIKGSPWRFMRSYYLVSGYVSNDSGHSFLF